MQSRNIEKPSSCEINLRGNNLAPAINGKTNGLSPIILLTSTPALNM